jgi:hypothetical protein
MSDMVQLSSLREERKSDFGKNTTRPGSINFQMILSTFFARNVLNGSIRTSFVCRTIFDHVGILTPPLTGDEGCPLEHFDVPCDCRQGHAKRLSQLVERRVSSDKASQDSSALGARKSGKCEIQVYHSKETWPSI